MRKSRYGAISAYLPPAQYVEFLKYCQKIGLSRHRIIVNAVISYCNIKNVPTTSDNVRARITKELDDILKEKK